VPGTASTSSGGISGPGDLTGLLAWYDSTNAGSFTFSSGVRVATWADLSGTGRHLVVGGGGIGPDRTGTQNSQTVVSFNNGGSANQSIEWWHATNRYYNGTALTFVAICRVRTDLGSNPRVAAFVHQPDQDWQVAAGAIPLGIDSGNFPAGYRGGSPLPGGSGLAAVGTWHVHVVVFNGTTCTVYMNSTTALGSTASTGTFDFNYFQLAYGTTGYCDVQIGDVFMYSHASSSTEVGQIITWGRAKWGF
jgi:hypothetical protein